MDLDLNQRVYIVADGGAGLGRAVTDSLVAEGARVVLAGSGEASLASAVADLGEARSTFVVTDAGRAGDAPTSLTVAAKDAWGRLDGALITMRRSSACTSYRLTGGTVAECAITDLPPVAGADVGGYATTLEGSATARWLALLQKRWIRRPCSGCCWAKGSNIALPGRQLPVGLELAAEREDRDRLGTRTSHPRHGRVHIVGVPCATGVDDREQRV